MLAVVGALVLGFFTNLLTLAVAFVGFFVYLVLYAFWKYRSFYGTLVGSIAGAVPPVVGYCAVSNRLDMGALLLFLILVLWQMPHFFAIAIFRLEDYTKANVPAYPIVKGLQKAKIRMVLYIIAFTAVSLLLTLFNYTGYIYFTAVLVLGFLWLALCLQGFNSTNDQLWGRRMFQLSLVLIAALSLIIPLDTV